MRKWRRGRRYKRERERKRIIADGSDTRNVRKKKGKKRIKDERLEAITQTQREKSQGGINQEERKNQ